MADTATRDSWKALPMPEQCVELDYRAEFTAEEFEQISLGRIPQDMDDKWFMFVEGETLHIHRSWTGFCIYQAEFEVVGDMHRVVRTVANRWAEQYKQADDAHDIKLAHWLIEYLLLDRDVELPRLPPNPPRLRPNKYAKRTGIALVTLGMLLLLPAAIMGAVTGNNLWLALLIVDVGIVFAGARMLK